MIRRFYAPSLEESPVELDAEQSRHAQRTLRLGVGATVELFDGRGTVASGRVERVGKTTSCVVEDRQHVAPPRPALTLAAAMPKGQRAEALVEGLVQAGVSGIVPLITERSVVEPGAGKRRRFERVAIEAAKQARRAHLPRIDEPRTFAEVISGDTEPGTVKLIADTPGDLQMMQDAYVGTPDGATLMESASVIVLVGPEGGWTEAERRAAADAGYARWCFNRFVLRVETAGLIAAGLIRAATVSQSE